MIEHCAKNLHLNATAPHVSSATIANSASMYLDEAMTFDRFDSLFLKKKKNQRP